MTTPRALILRAVDARIDALHCSDGDRALARALGLIAAGAFWLLAIAHHHSTRTKIGA